ncbi:MAG: PQQ-binding-like beta-propeller repeat protein [Candidatus Poribacteria bacterium]|nr:PQQ-binding-like beta-propeller repeat protein [Candidatus Poribacteria bacterium]
MRYARLTATVFGVLVAMQGMARQGVAQDAAMWGFSPSRNMISDATNVPTSWDVETGENIKWKATLGAQTYAGPVVSGGKVFVGTNNEAFKNPKLTADRGVIMAFDEASGEFLWQITHTKLPAGRVNDWPQQGICSTPFVDGDRLWYVSNRCTVVCVDTEGFRDGENDGPFTSEAETSEIDGDVIWEYDMMAELDVFPHNLAVCSPVIVGDVMLLVTGNGVDEGHVNIPSPFAPSFIAINKNTGELLWEDDSPGFNIVHGQWSNPSYGVVNGQPQAYFPGGDGWVYALDPATGEHLWKFDCNPKDSVWELGGGGTRNNLISSPVFYKNIVYIAVGQDPEHGEGIGHLYAIDATKTGDITESGLIWHRGNDKFNRSMTTVAVTDDLLYTADLSGYVYCLDTATGDLHWRYDMAAAIWGSGVLVDGKLYIGDEDGDLVILKAGKELEVVFETNMGSAMYTNPIPADGRLYLASRNVLYSVGE